MDRPLVAARTYASAKEPTEADALKIRALLQRSSALAHTSFFSLSAEGRIAVNPRTIKHLLAVEPAPGGGYYLLTREAFLSLDANGETLSRKPLGKGIDLATDAEGRPIVLAEGTILWGEREIPLPTGLKDPVSLAPSPDGNLILLDGGTRRLYRLDPDGKPHGGAGLLVRDPIKVRVDAAGRIYVADGDKKAVFVYGADLSPLRTIDPESTGHRLRKLRSMSVDFAGDVLLLDGRAHTLFLFSAGGRYLGATGGDTLRIDAAGWDGLGRLAFVTRKTGTVGSMNT